MKADDDVKSIINDVETGKLNDFLAALEVGDLGLYLPAFVENDSVKLMLKGYSQTEKNLVVSVSQTNADAIENSRTVGWVGSAEEKDKQCKHPGGRNCTHCTGHTQACKHCSGHSNSMANDLDAPRLDYNDAIKALNDKNDILKELAEKNLGLTLLHGHNNEHEFTKLPTGIVSVVANNVTSFRSEADVLSDPTFVPNMWRVEAGQFKVAGGYSKN